MILNYVLNSRVSMLVLKLLFIWNRLKGNLDNEVQILYPDKTILFLSFELLLVNTWILGQNKFDKYRLYYPSKNVFNFFKQIG